MDDRITTFYWPSLSASEFHSILAMAIAVLVLVIAILIVLARRNRRKTKLHQLKLLEEIAETTGLTDEEVDFLLVWIKKYKIRDVISITVSQAVYETCAIKAKTKLKRLDPYQKTVILETISSIRKKLGFDRIQYGHMIRTSHQLPVGQNVKIEVTREGLMENYYSVILENNEKALALEQPQKSGITVTFEENEELGIRFFREGDGEYYLKSRVLSSLGKRVRLEHCEQMERSQLRSFVRTDVTIPVTFHLVPSPKYPDKDAPVLRPEDAINGVITNMSSGGVKIETNSDLPEDAKFVNMKFNLFTTTLENVTGEILNRVGAGKLKYFNVKFKTISEHERGQVLVYVHETQSWMRKGTY